MTTTGKLSLALITIIVSLLVELWLSSGFMDSGTMGKLCIVSMGFSQRWFTDSSKAFVSRHISSRRIEQVFVHGLCVDSDTKERLAERHSNCFVRSRVIAVVLEYILPFLERSDQL